MIKLLLFVSILSCDSTDTIQQQQIEVQQIDSNHYFMSVLKEKIKALENRIRNNEPK